ncbi:inactive beta-amylase 9 isoform X2 [Euphorbia lathyris]|uniref:inactive beta-amylase 9 isoform X2 n=1 Tax=Euphorbia lathyris TaxID=212925 RepID=UPI0033137206
MSLIGSSQATVRGAELAIREQLRCCFPRRDINRVSFVDSTPLWRNSRLRLNRFTLKAIQIEPLRSDSLSSHAPSSSSKSNGVRLFVGLPLDAVSDCNTVNHTRAITAGLKALKLLGVEGVELPIWWGVVEKEAMGKYEWSGYLSLAEMVQKAGLKLHVSLCFHADQQHKLSLPLWVSRIGESEPDIFFKDRSGLHCKDCLSFAVDNLPVLDGKTPIEVYQDFCESFKSSFSRFMGSTITGITMGLGPNGELRYPSHHKAAKGSNGVGEFQCYDRNMLKILKQHAEATGNPLWGTGGPHDAPSYNELPNSNNFFNDNGGSWESTYGDFFLSWYSNQLLFHGDRLLSLASAAFGNSNVAIYAKLPLVHSWYKTRAHPSELTAGFYSTALKDGYEPISKMFARNSCKMILPGMDLLDEHQPQQSLSSPESLLAKIRMACRKFGVEISGQNSLISRAPYHFKQIRKSIAGENMVDLFTYQRMGAEFFSPEHFPPFTEFVRNLNQVEMHTDDLPEEEEHAGESLSRTSSGSSVEMQAV